VREFSGTLRDYGHRKLVASAEGVETGSNGASNLQQRL
jgi:hypothetical protein